MQYCKICGKEVRFIATSSLTQVMCDAKPVEAYTQAGRKLQAYIAHKCERGKDSESKA